MNDQVLLALVIDDLNHLDLKREPGFVFELFHQLSDDGELLHLILAVAMTNDEPGDTVWSSTLEEEVVGAS